MDGFNNNNLDLSDFRFTSNDHIRYVNGKDVSGHNYGCWRGIRIQNNITGDEGYSITIYNIDNNNLIWGNNLQMAPKQMKLVVNTETLIRFRGYGYDEFGASFSDYGISLHINQNQIEKISLHLFDRDVEIIYFKEAKIKRSSDDLEKLFTIFENVDKISDNHEIKNTVVKLAEIILNNRKIFDISETKELFDALWKSSRLLLTNIPESDDSFEKKQFIKASFFVLSKYREISPGNGTVYEYKVELLINYKEEILNLLKELRGDKISFEQIYLSYELMTYFLLNDNDYGIKYNPVLKDIQENYNKKYSCNSENLIKGKEIENLYLSLMSK